MLSNIKPELTCKITNSFFENNIATSRNEQLNALPLINDLFAETNPIPIKYAINCIGYDFGTPRLPLVECSSKKKKKIEKFLNEIL